MMVPLIPPARCYTRRRTGSFSWARSVAVMFALIDGPALAQNHVQQYGEQPKEKTATRKADESRAERPYRRSLDSGRTHCWHMVVGPP